MPKRERVLTLHLTHPFGQTLLLALLMAGGLFLIGEMVLRIPAVESELPAPSLGSNHDQFEIELATLQRFADDGPVDCLFVGSSMVRRGIDPAIIEQIYTEQTGGTMRCYVFGVNGATASVTSALLEYLVDTYHPRLIVFGISPRDFKIIPHKALDIPNLDWLRYTQGVFSVSGWLSYHSKLAQYAFYVQHWLNNDPVGKLSARKQYSAETLANGQGPIDNQLSMRNIEDVKIRVALLYNDYKPVDSELDALERILTYHHPPDTQVLLVELPIHPGITARLMRETDYQDFNEDISELAQAKGILYWSTTPLDLIAPSGWSDLNHLNRDGAAVFSDWLGHQIADVTLAGELVPVTSP